MSRWPALDTLVTPDAPLVSWIIPAFNEETRLPPTLRSVDTYLQGTGHAYEVIVVDNASRDQTREVVRAHQKVMPRLRYLFESRQGKGAAVRAGFAAARGAIHVFADADNATSPEHLDLMMPFFADSCDVVISSRHVHDAPGASVKDAESFLRDVAGRVGNWIIRGFLGIPFRDTQNGFKAFTAKAAHSLCEHATIDGYAFDIELLAISQRLRHRIAVVPATWYHNPDSRVTARAYARALVDVVRIRRSVARINSSSAA